MKAFRRGFTLIELLVVIGLIAVLAGVFGLALGRGNSGTALQTAQSTMAAMVAGARSQAAVAQTDAAVLINVEPSSEGFLRELRIATTTDNGATWIATGTQALLPLGIYLVPASGSFATTRVDYSTTPSWAVANRSSAFTGSVINQLESTNGSTNLTDDNHRVLVRFNARGTTGANTLSRIVFSPGQQTGDSTLVFDNPAALRGMTISNYGIATLRNDAESF